MSGPESWYDHEAGPLVRPFALTRGRAGTDRHNLDMISLIVSNRPLAEAHALNRECAAIVRMCQVRPLSVAEIAAKLDVLLAVAKVLISDLIDEGYLVRHGTLPSAGVPDMNLLQAVLDGVRKL
ncbi:MAG: DUF742 domain-containing protein [Kibdelosporangium sp.]